MTEMLPAVRLDIFSAGGSSATGAPVAVLSVPPLDDAGIADTGLGVHGRPPAAGEGVRVLHPATGGTPHA